MGYCYSGGKLCCDVCGSTGNVRKIKCPFNWCQPIALCPACKATNKYHTKAVHISMGCDQREREFDERERRTKAILANGLPVRWSAMGTDDGRVHVIFRNKNFEVKEAYYMSKKTYDAIDLLEPATPEDYMKFESPLEPAPLDFQ
jgi:hypothetical protein